MKQITCQHCGDIYPDFDVAHMCSKGPYAPKFKPKMKDISIEWMCDGWTVIVDGKRFSWDHNDEDMGTDALKELLTYLGHRVTIEECY